jgi:hypothetical protein
MHRLLIKGVDLGGVGLAAGLTDLLRHALDPFECSTGQVDLRSFTGEAAGHGPADRASASVDHSVLSIEQHVAPPRPGSAGSISVVC